jgi:hypothetical protein
MSVRLVQHLVSFLNNVEDLTDLERKLAFRAIGIVANGTLTMDEERRLAEEERRQAEELQAAEAVESHSTAVENWNRVDRPC